MISARKFYYIKYLGNSYCKDMTIFYIILLLKRLPGCYIAKPSLFNFKAL